MLQCMIWYSRSPCALWFLVSLVDLVKSSRHPNLLWAAFWELYTKQTEGETTYEKRLVLSSFLNVRQEVSFLSLISSEFHREGLDREKDRFPPELMWERHSKKIRVGGTKTEFSQNLFSVLFLKRGNLQASPVHGNLEEEKPFHLLERPLPRMPEGGSRPGTCTIMASKKNWRKRKICHAGEKKHPKHPGFSEQYILVFFKLITTFKIDLPIGSHTTTGLHLTVAHGYNKLWVINLFQLKLIIWEQASSVSERQIVILRNDFKSWNLIEWIGEKNTKTTYTFPWSSWQCLHFLYRLQTNKTERGFWLHVRFT